VICADSQETLTIPIPDGYADYRCRVDKIKPQATPNYTFVMGGSGDAALIDIFTDRFANAVWAWEAGLDGTTLRERVNDLVIAFYRDTVPLSTAEDKRVAFMLCVKPNTPGLDPYLWEIRGPGVIPIDHYSLIGWEEGIYKHFADRLYKDPKSSANRALLVGLYLMTLGKSTSNVIGGPTKAITVSSHGVMEIDTDSITTIENRIESFAKILEDLTLWCPDPSLPNREFPGYLEGVERELIELRERHFGSSQRSLRTDNSV